MATLEYLEETLGDTASSAVGFSMGGGRASATYLLDRPTAADLEAAVKDLIGYVDLKRPTGTTPGAGDAPPYAGIRRTMPRRHPVFRNLFCSAVTDIRGVGKYALKDAAPDAFIPAIPQYALHEQYWVKTEFKPLDYTLLPDSQVGVRTEQWWTEDGESRSYTYADEWRRFTDYTQTPKGEFVTAQMGQLQFRTQSNAQPGGSPGVPFQDSPRMYLPDQTVVLTWYQVPYRYVTSAKSFLSRFVGYVNQKDWYNWPKGSLLYRGCTPRKYTPPIQAGRGRVFGIGLGLDSSKLCDIDLVFDYTTRTGTDLPTDSHPAITANRNWVAAGHNLVPWLTTRKFYYATSFDPANPADPSKWRPIYPSCPFPLLFTDPDYPQPGA